MDTENKIFEIVAEVCETETNNITENSSIGDFPLWDSLGHLTILSAIEEVFEINFEPEKLMELEDVKNIINAVKSKLE
ncbi:MAG: acyl carrier protein [Prevotellaceae bacterium]|jgi:acyl carrier protein|nr:acyl carrier protein [Prevotellaceae bacterium]